MNEVFEDTDMTAKVITGDYLRDYFKIEDTPEGTDELALIQSRLICMEIPHGTEVIHIGDEADGMYFIESGMLEVLDAGGDQINVMHEGICFGEYAVISKQRRLSTVKAQGKCVIYKLENEDVWAVMARHPEVYAEMMKNVYSQVSEKHMQVQALSRAQRGILQDPENRETFSLKKTIIFYSSVVLVMALSLLYARIDGPVPVFALPIVFMIVYVLITKRTVESLVVATLYAALLAFRTEVSVGFTDAFMGTMGVADNIYTVLVMALMGGLFTVIEASGAVTAFGRVVEKKAHNRVDLLLMSVGIMFISSIDDCLNMMCAARSTKKMANKYRITREEQSVLYSFLPTVLCSFFPLSLWAIFVVGTMNATVKTNAFQLFCKSIPCNLYSIVVLIATVLFCCGKLPRTKRLRQAAERAEKGGKLWPEGSEKFLLDEDTKMWGKRRNLFIPIIVFTVASFAARSISGGSFMVDSACGLVFTIIVTFMLYCGQSIMSPEQFMEYLVQGIQSVALPIVLYLLAICFTGLLEELKMESFFDGLILSYGRIPGLLPFALFLLSMLLTWALGSSWAAYAISFPIGLRLCLAIGGNMPLCIGAICAAGIAGEKNCFLTADAFNVGNMIGCDPKPIRRIRIVYSLVFTAISAALYFVAGMFIK